MSNWTFTGSVAHRTLGVLSLRLVPKSMKVSPYERFEVEIFLRAGVAIGCMVFDQPLAKITVMASTEFLARLDAERQAEKWLEAHLDALCAGERFSG